MRSIKVIIFISTILISFFVTEYVLASEKQYYESLTIGTSINAMGADLTEFGLCNEMVATTSNRMLSSLSLVVNATTTESVQLHICKGTINNAISLETQIDCSASGQTELSDIIGNFTSTGTDILYNFDFSNVFIEGGVNHFWCIENGHDYLQVKRNTQINGDNSFVQVGGVATQQSFANWYYLFEEIFDPTVEVIDLPNWLSEYGLDSVSVESENDLYITTRQYCIIGDTCIYWLNYNNNVLGYDIYLCDEDTEECSTGKELIDVPIKEEYFNVTAIPNHNPIDPTTYNMCVLIPELYFIECGIEIIFVDDVLPNGLDFCDDWDCGCDNIATTTFNVAGNIQCGLTKLLCWGICPDDGTYIYYINSMSKLENVFPYSVYTQIKKEWQQIDPATSTSKLTINFTDLLGIEGYDEDLVLASSTIMSETMGTLWDTYIYPIMNNFVYFIFFVYLTIRLLGIARGSSVDVADNQFDNTTADISKGGVKLNRVIRQGKSKSRTFRF